MTSQRLQVRAFVALLRLFPDAFRAEYGGEMEALFRSRLARARGARGSLRLWVRTLTDVLATAIALRRAPHPPTRRRETMSTDDHPCAPAGAVRYLPAGAETALGASDSWSELRFMDGCHCRLNSFPGSNMNLDAEPSLVPGPAEPAPAGWWWSARRCPRCSRLVLERITPRADAVVAVHQIHCRTCSWSETTPV